MSPGWPEHPCVRREKVLDVLQVCTELWVLLVSISDSSSLLRLLSSALVPVAHQRVSFAADELDKDVLGRWHSGKNYYDEEVEQCPTAFRAEARSDDY